MIIYTKYVQFSPSISPDISQSEITKIDPEVDLRSTEGTVFVIPLRGISGDIDGRKQYISFILSLN